MPSRPCMSPVDCQVVSRVTLSIEGCFGDPFPCFARTHGQEVGPWGWRVMLPQPQHPLSMPLSEVCPEGGDRVVKGMADGTE